jgi:hypothetical protein
MKTCPECWSLIAGPADHSRGCPAGHDDDDVCDECNEHFDDCQCDEYHDDDGEEE